jgi:hypothetical protein
MDASGGRCGSATTDRHVTSGVGRGEGVASTGVVDYSRDARRFRADVGLRGYDGGMSTSSSTTPLQPVADEKNLLVTASDESAGSCCGGGCCGGN